MTIAAQPPTLARTRDPEQLLNALAPHVEHLTVNVMDGGPLWEREIALILRDNTMVRNMAERLLRTPCARWRTPTSTWASGSSSTSAYTS